MTEPSILITGGAGFIGVNAAVHFARQGWRVIVLDNLSRRGTGDNLDWLRQQVAMEFEQADIRDAAAMDRIIAHWQPEVLLHLAAQVAVTTSVADPREDFEINALGTFNLLEAVRQHSPASFFINASTNKVYGKMESVGVIERDGRYEYRDLPAGVAETQPLDFHSPYGCSKGVADQYSIDYARIYGLNTVTFRQSCLAADQAVLTPFGNKPIAELRAGDIVHSGHGWTRVRKVWRTGVKPVRRLTTMGGLSVTLTDDHRMMRPHGLYRNRDFGYGDFLATLPEARYAPHWEPVADTVLDAESFLQAVHDRTSDMRCRNEAARIAERLLPLGGDRLLAIAEVVGRLCGDGNLSIHRRQNRNNPSYYVQHYGSRDELAQVAQWLAWIGLPASGVVESTSSSTLPSGHVINGTSCRIQQQTIPVCTLFELLGVPVGDKVRVDYEVPRWVRNGHRLVKRAFLRGLFGAELGRVYVDSYIAPSLAQSKDIDYLESGRRWVEQLRALLAEFDIETSCFEAAPTAYNRGTTVQMTIRLLGGYSLYPKLASIGYGCSPARSGHLNSLLRWTGTHTSPQWYESLNELYRADGHLFWDSLMRIEEQGLADVYDLEVEDDSHLFIAGGIQLSNCIYGTRQFGIEDQGWVAWFTIAAVLDKPITIYGDGKQIRDVLHVRDLVRAYEAAIEHRDRMTGLTFNIGGGSANTLSLLELLAHLRDALGKEIQPGWSDWRPGDQPVFVCNIDQTRRQLGWEPSIGVREGVGELIDWVRSNRDLFQWLA